MMPRLAYLFVFSFFAIWFEVVLRTFGVFLPLEGLFLFYAGVIYRPGWSLTAAVIGGAALDYLMGHTLPVSALSLCAVVVLSWFWLYKVESDSALLPAIPGAVIPLIYYLPLLVYHTGGAPDWWVVLSVLFSVFAAAILLPLLILLLDTLNQSLRMPLYMDVKLKKERP